MNGLLLNILASLAGVGISTAFELLVSTQRSKRSTMGASEVRLDPTIEIHTTYVLMNSENDPPYETSRSRSPERRSNRSNDVRPLPDKSGEAAKYTEDSGFEFIAFVTAALLGLTLAFARYQAAVFTALEAGWVFVAALSVTALTLTSIGTRRNGFVFSRIWWTSLLGLALLTAAVGIGILWIRNPPLLNADLVDALRATRGPSLRDSLPQALPVLLVQFGGVAMMCLLELLIFWGVMTRIALMASLTANSPYADQGWATKLILKRGTPTLRVSYLVALTTLALFSLAFASGGLANVIVQG